MDSPTRRSDGGLSEGNAVLASLLRRTAVGMASRRSQRRETTGGSSRASDPCAVRSQDASAPRTWSAAEMGDLSQGS